MLTDGSGMAEDGGDAAAHGRAVRADLRLLADDRAIDMVDGAAARADELGRVARNRSDAAPFHCGSLGGKCSPMSPSPAAPSRRR